MRCKGFSILTSLPLLAPLLAARGADEGRPEPPPSKLQALVDLLQTPITVASTRPRTLMESPGVVTCITREEILASGARDLMDVLRLVPGFDLAYDNRGATGLAVRGLWAFEGKAMFLWNGIELPELLTGTMPLGHRLPVDQIKRIEIIRGPGSAKYGGGAELAVINIVPLGAEHMDGPAGGFHYGTGGGTTIRQGAHVLFAHTFDSGLTLDFTAFGDRGRRSARPWTDNGGNERDASLNSEMRSALVTFGVGWRGLKVRGLADDYTLQDPIYRPSQAQQWYKSRSQNLNASWEIPLSRGLTLTPYASFRRDAPNHRILRPRPNPLDFTVHRLRTGMRLDWVLSPIWNLALGSEYTRDRANTSDETSSSFYLGPGKARSAEYHDDSSYLEVCYRGPVEILVGGRYERHSAAGSAFVPRFSLTKTFRRWHFKLLHAEAFRTPGILHYKTSSSFPLGLEPERTRTSEMEAGFTQGSWVMLLNLFRIRLERPIYDFGQAAANGPGTGSRGVELTFKLRQRWGFVNASYAYHGAFGVEALLQDGLARTRTTVPGQDDRFLAVAQHTVSASAGIWLGSNLSLDPSLTWMGSRYGGQWIQERRRTVVSRSDPALLLNLQLAWRKKEFTFSLGVADLLDQRPGFQQAYFNSQVPLPDAGREWILKARWGF